MTAKTIPQQQTAAYITEARDVIAKIVAALGVMESSAAHYGHVGDARHVAELLADVESFACQTHV